MTLGQPLFMENDTTDQHAIGLRQMIKDMFSQRGGVFPGGGLLVSQRGAGANMSVDVAAGGAVWPGSVTATQGFYYAYNDAVVNVPITAAHPSNPRYSSIILKARDAFYSGSDNDGQILSIDGTAAASPSPPDLVALGHTNFYKLADVLAAAADTSITNGEITDWRFPGTAAGGIYKVPTTASVLFAALGDMAYTTTAPKQHWVHDGTAWVPNNSNIIARQKLTANSAALSGSVNTDMVLSTVPMKASRLYRLHATFDWITTGACTYVWIITEDGTQLATAGITDGDRHSVSVSILLEPTTANHTYRVAQTQIVGGFSTQLLGSSTQPRWMWIEDVGPR